MNYRHSYHAGNFADVFKHSLLILLIEALLQKEKGFCLIDTHAGIGSYSLSSEQARKTMESEQGICKLLSFSSYPDEIKKYLDIIAKINNTSIDTLQNELSIYPGSPVIMQALRRCQDAVILNELHEEDFLQLKQLFKRNSRIACHQRDAYELLPAILPPSLRRGLIFIDPPYEKSDEFVQIESVLQQCLERFANGIYAIWYPITDQRHQAFTHSVTNKLRNPILICEITLSNKLTGQLGLIGTGMLIVNPPWQIEVPMEKLVKFLHQVFDSQNKGAYQLRFSSKNIRE